MSLNFKKVNIYSSTYNLLTKEQIDALLLPVVVVIPEAGEVESVNTGTQVTTATSSSEMSTPIPEQLLEQFVENLRNESTFIYDWQSENVSQQLLQAVYRAIELNNVLVEYFVIENSETLPSDKYPIIKQKSPSSQRTLEDGQENTVFSYYKAQYVGDSFGGNSEASGVPIVDGDENGNVFISSQTESLLTTLRFDYPTEFLNNLNIDKEELNEIVNTIQDDSVINSFGSLTNRRISDLIDYAAGGNLSRVTTVRGEQQFVITNSTLRR